MKKIGIFFAPHNRRSTLVGRAMQAGAKKLGIKTDLRRSTHVPLRIEYDAVLFYGFAEGLRNLFSLYKEHGRAVYIDLGYWGRRKVSRYDGYHKLAVNSRHSTAYLQNIKHPPDRFARFRIPIMPWQKRGKAILLAGMSAKASQAEGFGPEQWEREAVAQIRQVTDRTIIYRPKPNWSGAKLIPGTQMQRDVPLRHALSGAHCVVSHHSNVGVDALLAGVPVVSVEGVASVLGSTSLEGVVNPVRPEGREQWACDLAYTQYTMQEMQDGMAMRYLLDEGLI